jgi:hypothetical protein
VTLPPGKDRRAAVAAATHEIMQRIAALVDPPLRGRYGSPTGASGAAGSTLSDIGEHPDPVEVPGGPEPAR